MMRWLLACASLMVGLTALVCAVAPPPSPQEIPEQIQGAEGLSEALRNLKAKMVNTPPLTPTQAQAAFRPRPGMAVDLIASEPTVRQPLYLQFDERGRLWVVQYRQYPFPAGLKVVAYDRYIRAKFDRVPPPPPNHFPGQDRITIHEDTRGDGTFDRVTTFIDGLNIATAALPGRGGVWVLNPPYLLFYPDPTRCDRPGKPVVHLSGFGLEDTHAVASSLTWGPDGWIYGAHGSTCTAKVRAELSGSDATTNFLGQAIWRYHPEQHRFELFAEGGGNTFGVAFDDFGRVYSGTNWGVYRGLHYVQGGYYIKGWGKHGPLTNPYALGYFDHMPHQGNADRLVHAMTIYGESALPELASRIVGVNALQRRVQVTALHPLHSTFRTVEEPFLLTTSDERFRPVDVKPGPDGALYVADLYEPRINHVDPRDNWDRATGRIWRIRPEKFTPAPRQDLARLSTAELVSLLKHPSRWYRDTALRLLGDRKDRTALIPLRKLFQEDSERTALYGLWGLQVCGGLDEETLQAGITHASPHLRRWAIRLIGDRGSVSDALGQQLIACAAKETDVEVRSQLASSAKRLPGPVCLGILRGLWRHDADVKDPHLPLLGWWALESKAESHREAIVKLFPESELWTRPLVEQFILERLMQRWAMAGGLANLTACARLLEQAPDQRLTTRLLAGLEKGFAGRSTGELPQALVQAVTKAWERSGQSSVLLGMRMGHAPSLQRALELIADEKAPRNTRLECLKILGEIDLPRSVPVLLQIVRQSPSAEVRQEALTALARYREPTIAGAILDLYPDKLPEAGGVRGAAHNLLVSRPEWALALLQRIDAGKINPRTIPIDVIQKLALHRNSELTRLIGKHFGRVRASATQEKQQEILRLAKYLQTGKGDPSAGKIIYANLCAKCHKLFGQGGEVGPELTGYERGNALYWLENIVDPSAVIREEYASFVVETTDGRTLSGIIAAQDKTTVTLRDPEGRTVRLDRSKIEELRASPVSLMPEGQLSTLSEKQVRDLFAYLMSPAAK